MFQKDMFVKKLQKHCTIRIICTRYRGRQLYLFTIFDMLDRHHIFFDILITLLIWTRGRETFET